YPRSGSGVGREEEQEQNGRESTHSIIHTKPPRAGINLARKRKLTDVNELGNPLPSWGRKRGRRRNEKLNGRKCWGSESVNFLGARVRSLLEAQGDEMSQRLRQQSESVCFAEGLYCRGIMPGSHDNRAGRLSQLPHHIDSRHPFLDDLVVAE